ncbi:MAG: endonuclease [Candidatus Marinimicrobia bacterium]|nr:endonuclease [Candidatus Neomarinimicrobiota bacterium]
MRKLTSSALFMITATAWAVVPFRADVNVLTPGAVTISTNEMEFGDVNLDESVQRTLLVYNGTDDTLDISGTITTSTVFNAAQWTVTTLPPMDSAAIGVDFSPETNIIYNGFMLTQVSECEQGIVVALAGAGRSSADYALTFNKFGEELKAALPNLFPGQTDLGYNGARATMYGLLDNHNDSLTGVYTGFTQAWPYGSTGTYPNPINCEHSWPQSFFDSDNPMRGDIHHLFPTHQDANGRRSNYPFDNVTQNVTWQQGGSLLGQNSFGETAFEPRDVHKGDAARAIFYFVTRYGNLGGYLGEHQEATLREWFWSDPVSQKEIDRNDGIDQYQHNRNPFVDHPEFLERVSSFVGTATVSTAPQIAVAPQSMTYSMTRSDTVWLTVANAGDADLEIVGVNENESWLTVLVSTPQTLPPGGTLQVGIAFEPDNGAGEYAGAVHILNNDSNSGTVTRAVTIQYDPASGIAETGTPAGYQLLHAYPNPFNASTNLIIQRSSADPSEVTLYNLKGQQIRQWEIPAGSGTRRIMWNARAGSGAEVSSGIYLVRVTQGQHSVLERLALLR